MPGPTAQESLISIVDDLNDEYRRWRAMIISMSAREACRRFDRQWSSVETLAHITSWKNSAVRIASVLRHPGESDVGPATGPAGVLHINVQAFNEETLSRWSGASAAETLRWADRVHRGLIMGLSLLPVDRLVQGRGRHGARQWYWMPGWTHSRGHRHRLASRLRDHGIDVPSEDEG